VREKGQHHQQHQVGGQHHQYHLGWCIYKSSEVFFIGSIFIPKGMPSSSASICISIKTGYIIIIIAQGWLIIIQGWLYVTAIKLEARYLSHLIVLLYVTALKLEARYSSCFTSQPSGWKQDTRLALRHSYPTGSSVLVSSYHLALRLTTRSEARNVSSCFTSHNWIRSKEHLILLYV
jgi:hypothetical protein